MLFHENLMKYHTLFFRKLGKMLQNLSSAAVLIGALRVLGNFACFFREIKTIEKLFQEYHKSVKQFDPDQK